MAISVGAGHLVFGSFGHLKRSSSDHHLLRRESIIVSSPSELKTGYNQYDAGDGTKAGVYPAIYDNRYDVTWVDGSLGASSGWGRWWPTGGPFVWVYVKSYARSNTSYAAYDTSSVSGTSVSSVAINATSYTASAGGGAFYVGFRTSSSGTADDSYSWITGASELFAITASGAQTKTFSSPLTFSSYLFVTVWVVAYEPPNSYFGTGISTPPTYNPNHLFALSTEFRFTP
jgi:hypothetical protein